METKRVNNTLRAAYARIPQNSYEYLVSKVPTQKLHDNFLVIRDVVPRRDIEKCVSELTFRNEIHL